MNVVSVGVLLPELLDDEAFERPDEERPVESPFAFTCRRGSDRGELPVWEDLRRGRGVGVGGEEEEEEDGAVGALGGAVTEDEVFLVARALAEKAASVHKTLLEE